MSDAPVSRRVLSVLVDAAEHEQTVGEAEAELLADGVNVTAFLASVHQAIHQQKLSKPDGRQ